jgi:hypothetical protein
MNNNPYETRITCLSRVYSNETRLVKLLGSCLLVGQINNTVIDLSFRLMDLYGAAYLSSLDTIYRGNNPTLLGGTLLRALQLTS